MKPAIQHTVRMHFGRGNKSEKTLRAGAKPVVSIGRVPRVARLLALAHRFDELVEEGVATDYADLARLGHVTWARVTQIINLLTLAPDIQEKILYWPPVTEGKDPISERGLRDVVAELEWRKQRTLYDLLLRSMCPICRSLASNGTLKYDAFPSHCRPSGPIMIVPIVWSMYGLPVTTQLEQDRRRQEPRLLRTM
ncbi:MAG: hypothetical protein JWM11_5426 [Planctomycetaceae bacterium]|nr:hypothetical protein [Planctomycetaceae bacterium]